MSNPGKSKATLRVSQTPSPAKSLQEEVAQPGRKVLTIIRERGAARPQAASREQVLREVHVLGLSIWKIAILVGIVFLLFGKGKVSGLMGDLAQGIKSFKKGMSEDEAEPKIIGPKPMETASTVKEKVSG